MPRDIKESHSATLWRTPVILSFVLLFIGGSTLFWFLAHVTPADEVAYTKMVEKGRQRGGTHWRNKTLSTKQQREEVVKEVYFWKEKDLLKLRIFTPNSEMIAERKEEKIEFKEILGEVTLFFQEELYEKEGVPRQHVRFLTGKSGEIDFSGKQIKLKKVRGKLFDFPGHELPESIEGGDLLMEGTADVVELDMRDTSKIKAKNFRGKVFKVDFSSIQGEGEAENLEFDFGKRVLTCTGQIDFEILDVEKRQQFLGHTFGECVLDLDQGLFSAKSSNEQQLKFTSGLGALRADECVAHFEQADGSFTLTSCKLSGHVSAHNRFSEMGQMGGALDQYLLADSLSYNPKTEWWTLDSNSKRSVLFYDAVHSLQVSARSIEMRSQEGASPEVKGHGDVRFSFKNEELKKLKTHFPGFSTK